MENKIIEHKNVHYNNWILNKILLPHFLEADTAKSIGSKDVISELYILQVFGVDERSENQVKAYMYIGINISS